MGTSMGAFILAYYTAKESGNGVSWCISLMESAGLLLGRLVALNLHAMCSVSNYMAIPNMVLLAAGVVLGVAMRFSWWGMQIWLSYLNTANSTVS
jgi:hypothetical protein